MNPIANLLDCRDAVMQEVDLPLPGELALNRVANDPFVVWTNQRIDWNAIQRRRLDRAHVLRAHQRQVKRSGNRRGGKSQQIDQPEEILELLFVEHAEALLFV